MLMRNNLPKLKCMDDSDMHRGNTDPIANDGYDSIANDGHDSIANDGYHPKLQMLVLHRKLLFGKPRR